MNLKENLMSRPQITFSKCRIRADIYKLPSGICIKVLEQPKKGDYERSRLLMCGMKYYLILSAVIDRTSPGTIYVDDLGEPHTAFVCTVEGTTPSEKL
jgi:hypothetical protein